MPKKEDRDRWFYAVTYRTGAGLVADRAGTLKITDSSATQFDAYVFAKKQLAEHLGHEDFIFLSYFAGPNEIKV